LVAYEAYIESICKEMVVEQDFRASPGTQCHWCPFALRCDAAQRLLPSEFLFQGKTIPIFIDSPEAAMAIGEGVLHLEAAAQRFRKALGGYIRENEVPVQVGDKKWDYHKKKTLKLVDHVGFAQFVLQHYSEEQIGKTISFNGKSGKGVIKNDSKAHSFFEEQQYTKFGYEGGDGDEDD
jgi:hypothetical protein